MTGRRAPARLPAAGPASWAGGGAALGAAAVGLVWAVSSTRVPPAEVEQPPRLAAAEETPEPAAADAPAQTPAPTSTPARSEAEPTPDPEPQPQPRPRPQSEPAPPPAVRPDLEPLEDPASLPSSDAPAPVETTAEPVSPDEPDTVRIAVNTATIAELDLLPRIGPVIAQRIIDERDANGPFRDLDDLQQRVSGIGPRTAERLAPLITFD